MRYWVVMLVQKMADLKIRQVGFRFPIETRVLAPEEEPFYFLPLFESYESALKWTGGDPTHIRECLAAEPQPEIKAAI